MISVVFDYTPQQLYFLLTSLYSDKAKSVIEIISCYISMLFSSTMKGHSISVIQEKKMSLLF